MKNKRIIMSVTNDLTTDQRVRKVCETLTGLDYDILLIGRILPDSANLNRPYACKRMKLFFNKGALFYAEYNLRLFFLLLFSKVDIYHSNDLDTLLANYLASKIRRKPIVYDSHEYFTGVPEIQNRKLVKNTWKIIEGWIFPKLKHVFTVNQSIADLYKKEYDKDIQILRNIPHKLELTRLKSKAELNIPDDKNLIITQGAGINIDRGIEEAVEALQYLDDVCLMIIGNGDVIPKLKKMVVKLNLKNSVIFRDRMPYDKMMQYTRHAQLGLTLDKNTNINYKLSLPNKLFDYVHAGTPVLATRLVEVEKVIKKYDIGLFIDKHEPKHIAQQIKRALNDEKLNSKWTLNLKRAAAELQWENEEKTLIKAYKKIEG